jgi:hypothetical protein
MTDSNVANLQKRSIWKSGCLIILALIFGLQGIASGLVALLFLSADIAARMWYTVSVILLAVAVLSSASNLWIAFRIGKQKWWLSAALVVFAWGCLPIASFSAANTTLYRLQLNGHSMEPTLLSGDLVLADKQAYRNESPQRGDVVLYMGPWGCQSSHVNAPPFCGNTAPGIFGNAAPPCKRMQIVKVRLQR